MTNPLPVVHERIERRHPMSDLREAAQAAFSRYVAWLTAGASGPPDHEAAMLTELTDSMDSLRAALATPEPAPVPYTPEPCPYCNGAGCLPCRGRGTVGPAFRSNRGLPPYRGDTP